MYGSPTMSKDLNLPFPGSPFRLGKEEAHLHHPHSHQQHQQMGSGLLRYRSAPSTVLGEVCQESLPHRASSPEPESMFARFMGPDLRGHIGEKQQQTSEVAAPPQSAGFPSPSSPQMFFQLHHQQQHHHQQQQLLPNLSSAVSTDPAAGPFYVMSSMGLDHEQEKSGNLIRQSSSPAGLFSHLNIDNGFAAMRGMGGAFRPSSAAASNVDSGRLKDQISLSSRQGSVMSQISEIGNEAGSSPEHGAAAARSFIPGFPVASSWEDSLIHSDRFAKRMRDPSEAAAQNGHVPSLAYQFSFPKSSPEMAIMERFLQFQDAVPCKIRAKRGCATHPRSIAERVRRTRISERMRKLEELVPNMDKQMNTADMLDLAVEYIKDLQSQAKTLSETRASCTCSSSKKKP